MNYHYLAGFIVCLILLTNGAYAVVIDNFSDGDYTSNPVWTVRNGPWDASSFYLNSTVIDAIIVTSKSSAQDANLNLVTNIWYFDMYPNPSTGQGIAFAVTDDNGNNSNHSVALYMRADSTMGLFFNSFGTDAGDFNSNVPGQTWATIKLQRTVAPDCNWSVFVNGVIKKSYQFCGNATNNNYYKIIHTGGTGEARIDNILYGTASSVTANFNYVVNKADANIAFTSTSNASGTTITDWNWLINGVKVSDDVNYTKTGVTQLTDYNVCLQVGDGSISDQKCTVINSGDWTAPNTSISFSQVTGQSIQQIRFTCTDNNSGCKWTTYWTDTNTTRNIVTNTGTKDINISGAGTKTIYYYSTDNSDNNETTDSNSFTTYGSVHFTFKDENSGATVTSVGVNFNGNDTTTTGNQYDINLANLTLTDTSYLFTFSKTGYSTRYYQADLNQLTDLNKTIVLLSDLLDADIPFKVYETDETTLFTNTYIEILDADTNYTLSRLKTDSLGEVTFNIKADDQNYFAIINNGAYVYVPLALTILYPKNEETLAQITEKWKIDITQNLYVSYTDLNATKIVYLLPNTGLPFNIKISDMNGNYFSRTYSKTYPGNPLTDTLQPYLVDTTTGLLTTINTINVLTNDPVPTITIKIYKNISGLGRTLVEQITTDDKGQSLSLLVLNSDYEFEIYDSDLVYIRTDTITATSSNIWIKIASSGTVVVDPNTSYHTINVAFTPSIGKMLFTTTSLTQKIDLTRVGVNLDTLTSIKIWVTNKDVNGVSGNDRNVYLITIPTTALTYTYSIDINTLSNSLDGNIYDTNGNLVVYVQVTASDGTITLNSFSYSHPKTYSLVKGLGTDLKTMMGCPATNDPLIPCGTLLLIALFLSLILTIGLAVETGFTSMEGMGVMFLGIMAIFTYLAWVPYILYGLMVITTIVIAVALGGNKL